MLSNKTEMLFFNIVPAGDDDHILRDVSHLFDGEVAHPPQCLLIKVMVKCL